jgi:hypothetical protein
MVLEGFDAAGKPKTRKAKRDITLRHLLTHTAGFGYDIWSPELGKYQEVMGVPGIISCQNVALTTPLLFDPGERWFYGINIDWAPARWSRRRAARSSASTWPSTSSARSA